MTDSVKKVALVTGAGAGIGRATAQAFAAAGYAVAVSDRDAVAGEQTRDLITEQGGDAIAIAADVSQPRAVQHLLAQVCEHYGRLDCAFNNAGIEGRMASTAECSEADWDATIATNLKGVWLCMKYELPLLLAQHGGAIVNCASVAGLVGFPNLPAYVASKHGVVGLSKTAALECAKQGVRVNAVCPGAVHTAMIERLIAQNPGFQPESAEPVGRMASPDEIAQVVVWLCSDRAAFVTGHALAVDGGWVAQ